MTLGAVSVFWVAGYMTTLLTDVSATDPTVFLSAAGLLVVVAIVSVYLPARAAAKTDPMIALRAD